MRHWLRLCGSGAGFMLATAAIGAPACVPRSADVVFGRAEASGDDVLHYQTMSGRVRGNRTAVPLCAGVPYRIVPSRRPGCNVVVAPTGSATELRTSLRKQLAGRPACTAPIVTVAAANGQVNLDGQPGRIVAPSGSLDTRRRRQIVVLVAADPAPPGSSLKRVPDLLGLSLDTARTTAGRAGFTRLVQPGEAGLVDAAGTPAVAWQYPAPGMETRDTVLIVHGRIDPPPPHCPAGPVTRRRDMTVGELERAYRAAAIAGCPPLSATLLNDGQILERDNIDPEAWTVTATWPRREQVYDSSHQTPVWFIRPKTARLAPQLTGQTVDTARRRLAALGLPPPLLVGDDRRAGAADSGSSVITGQQPRPGAPVTAGIAIRAETEGPGDTVPAPLTLAAGAGAGAVAVSGLRYARRPDRADESAAGPDDAPLPAAAGEAKRVRGRPDRPPAPSPGRSL